MKKLGVCILALALALGPAAAMGSSEISDITFDITSAYMEGVNFTYPVVDTGDAAQSDALNSAIETDALSPFSAWAKDDTAEGGLVYILREGDVLSLGYQMSATMQDASHPLNLYFTAVYDVKTAQHYRLSDFADLNKAAAVLAGGAELRPGLSDVEDAVFAAQTEYVSGLKQEEILQMLENKGYEPGQDPFLSQSFFLWGPGDELYIALSVPHAVGDWAVFLVSKAEAAK